MTFWKRLKYLLPSYRHAQERDMSEELQSLAAIAEAGELGNLTRAAEEARAVWGWTWLDQLYRDVQYALPEHAPQSWIHCNRGAVAGARRRSQYRNLQLDGCSHVAMAAGS